MVRSVAILLCLGVVIAAPRAEAQNPQPAPPGVTSPPVASPSAPSPPPERIAPPEKDVPGTNGNLSLSDKLARQQGMLDPPHEVDPGMAITPPQTQGTMPVIPPPGSPGANQQVQPK